MNYQREKTIHKSTILNVETDTDGNVVSVWYNCVALPFSQSAVDSDRAKEMQRMSNEINKSIRINGIDFSDSSRTDDYK